MKPTISLSGSSSVQYYKCKTETSGLCHFVYSSNRLFDKRDFEFLVQTDKHFLLCSITFAMNLLHYHKTNAPYEMTFVFNNEIKVIKKQEVYGTTL